MSRGFGSPRDRCVVVERHLRGCEEDLRVRESCSTLGVRRSDIVGEMLFEVKLVAAQESSLHAV